MSLHTEQFDGSEFMGLFLKMFNETKYTLQALNKRMEFMERSINNVLLLNSDKAFDEEEENELEISPEEIEMIAERYLDVDTKSGRKKCKEGSNGSNGSSSSNSNRKEKFKVVKRKKVNDDNDNDSDDNGFIISEKVNIDKKVMKYSEFLKLKQSRYNNSGSGCSKIINNSIKQHEPQIKECNIIRQPIYNNNNNNEQSSLLPLVSPSLSLTTPSTLNITNLNANDIFNYIDSLEKSNNLLNIKHSRQ